MASYNMNSFEFVTNFKKFQNPLDAIGVVKDFIEKFYEDIERIKKIYSDAELREFKQNTGNYLQQSGALELLEQLWVKTIDPRQYDVEEDLRIFCDLMHIVSIVIGEADNVEDCLQQNTELILKITRSMDSLLHCAFGEMDEDNQFNGININSSAFGRWEELQDCQDDHEKLLEVILQVLALLKNRLKVEVFMDLWYVVQSFKDLDKFKSSNTQYFLYELMIKNATYEECLGFGNGEDKVARNIIQVLMDEMMNLMKRWRPNQNSRRLECILSSLNQLAILEVNIDALEELDMPHKYIEALQVVTNDSKVQTLLIQGICQLAFHRNLKFYIKDAIEHWDFKGDKQANACFKALQFKLDPKTSTPRSSIPFDEEQIREAYQRRILTIKEMERSEIAYTKGLKVMTEKYAEYMLQHKIDLRDRRIINSNIREILELHNGHFLPAIKDCVQISKSDLDKNEATTFLKCVEKLEIFAMERSDKKNKVVPKGKKLVGKYLKNHSDHFQANKIIKQKRAEFIQIRLEIMKDPTILRDEQHVSTIAHYLRSLTERLETYCKNFENLLSLSQTLTKAQNKDKKTNKLIVEKLKKLKNDYAEAPKKIKMAVHLGRVQGYTPDGKDWENRGDPLEMTENMSLTKIEYKKRVKTVVDNFLDGKNNVSDVKTAFGPTIRQEVVGFLMKNSIIFCQGSVLNDQPLELLAELNFNRYPKHTTLPGTEKGILYLEMEPGTGILKIDKPHCYIIHFKADDDLEKWKNHFHKMENQMDTLMDTLTNPADKMMTLPRQIHRNTTHASRRDQQALTSTPASYVAPRPEELKFDFAIVYDGSSSPTNSLSKAMALSNILKRRGKTVWMDDSIEKKTGLPDLKASTGRLYSSNAFIFLVNCNLLRNVFTRIEVEFCLKLQNEQYAILLDEDSYTRFWAKTVWSADEGLGSKRTTVGFEADASDFLPSCLRVLLPPSTNDAFTSVPAYWDGDTFKRWKHANGFDDVDACFEVFDGNNLHQLAMEWRRHPHCVGPVVMAMIEMALKERKSHSSGQGGRADETGAGPGGRVKMHESDMEEELQALILREARHAPNVIAQVCQDLLHGKRSADDERNKTIYLFFKFRKALNALFPL